MQSWLLLYHNLVRDNLDNPTERWLASLGPEDIHRLDRSPIKRDMVTLLKYCRDHPVRATAYKGNFPRTIVKELIGLLVNVPDFDKEEFVLSTIRSEDDIAYIHFLHYMADLCGFLTGGPSRAIKPTPDAEAFLALMAPLQVSFLLFIWWNFMDWEVTSYDDESSRVLPVIKRTVYRLLAGMEVGKKVEYQEFLNQLIAQVDAAKGFEQKKPSAYIITYTIDDRVIKTLADLAVLKVEWQPHPTLGLPFEDLASFQMTSLGRNLLKNLLLIKAEDILPSSPKE